MARSARARGPCLRPPHPGKEDDDPNLIPAGEAFIRKWGSAAIFIARFSGPLRASVPIVAGVFAMPYGRFQVANFTSALVWAWVLLSLGDVTSVSVKWFVDLIGKN